MFKNIRLSFILLLFMCACSTQEVSEVDKMVDDVWEYSLTHSSGFTVTIPNLEDVSDGFSVAYYLGDNVGKASLKGVIEHALEHDLVVGGWLDTETDIYYFDSVRIFPLEEADSAYNFAAKNKQIAYYDLTNDLTIYVE